MPGSYAPRIHRRYESEWPLAFLDKRRHPRFLLSSQLASQLPAAFTVPLRQHVRDPGHEGLLELREPDPREPVWQRADQLLQRRRRRRLLEPGDHRENVVRRLGCGILGLDFNQKIPVAGKVIQAVRRAPVPAGRRHRWARSSGARRAGPDAPEHVGMALVEGTGDEAGGHALEGDEIEAGGDVACEGAQRVGDGAAPREEALVRGIVLRSGWWLALRRHGGRFPAGKGGGRRHRGRGAGPSACRREGSPRVGGGRMGGGDRFWVGLVGAELHDSASGSVY